MKETVVRCDLCHTEGAMSVHVSPAGGEPFERDLCKACLTNLRGKPEPARKKFRKVPLPPQPQ